MRDLVRLARLALLAGLLAWPYLGRETLGSWRSPATLRPDEVALAPASRPPALARTPADPGGPGPTHLTDRHLLLASPEPPAPALAGGWVAGSLSPVPVALARLQRRTPRFPTGPPPVPALG